MRAVVSTPSSLPIPAHEAIKREPLQPLADLADLITMASVSEASAQPKVGIFWVHDGKLLSAVTSLDKGAHSPYSIDSPFDHIDYWARFQKEQPELVQLGYEDVPRGRVLFLKEEKRFSVYMDKRLHVPRTKKLILAAFALPKTQTKFLTDPHYTTDPAELDWLFEDS